MNVIVDFFGLFLTQVTKLFQNAFSLVFKFTKIQMVDYLAPIEVVSSFGDDRNGKRENGQQKCADHSLLILFDYFNPFPSSSSNETMVIHGFAL